MKTLDIAYRALCVACFVIVWLLAGCELGNTVMLSKGEAGGFSQAFGGKSEYCKFTSTEKIQMSAEAQEAFVKYCADVE